ncbi:MAG: hypothetical protein KGQ60_04270 [Planctomycetes bacterium]|nr:hypothetical protein [Planctomycetota bacterium]
MNHRAGTLLAPCEGVESRSVEEIELSRTAEVWDGMAETKSHDGGMIRLTGMD